MNRLRRPHTKLEFVLAIAGLICSLSGSTAHAQENRQFVKTGSSDASTSKRIALVIGNGAYTSAPTLKNPPNDARDMAATLKALGFDVTSGINVSQRDMKRLVREFGQKLKMGGSGLFYYAGHGVQSKGRNYLIPVDAEIQSEAEVEDSGVDVSLVLNYMDDAQNGLNIVILDACRNNPFSRSFRSATEGLAQVDAPTGTLIAYATAPGRVASDGTGQNGLYTSELLKEMRVPGLSVTEMFMRVRAGVMKQTGNKQVPWEASSLVGAFYFAGSPISSSLQNTPMSISEAAKEEALWEAAKNSNDPQDFRDYLSRYPNGAYAAAAHVKVRQLDAARSSPNSSPTSTQPTNPASNVPAAKSVSSNTSRAYQLFQQKQFASAAQEAKQIAANDPVNSEAWKLAGFSEFYLRQYADASEDLQKALDLQRKASQEDSHTITALAESYVLAEKYDRALPLLIEVIERPGANPDPSFLYYRGLAELKTGKPADAERSFNAAIKANPKDAASLLYLSQIALTRNDLDAAISTLNRATINDPRLASAWFLLTSAYLRRAATATDEAKSNADYLSAVRSGETLTLLRSDEEALGLYGRALIGAKQYARAAAVLERATAQGDLKGVTLYLLGLAHSRARNFPRAIAALQQAQAKSPNDLNVYRELGYDYELTKQYPKAFAVYQRAVEIAPNDLNFRESLERLRPFAK